MLENNLRLVHSVFAAGALLLGSAPAFAANVPNVVLDDVAVKNLGLEMMEVEETTFEETIFALGRIEILPGSQSVVSTRIPGRILEVLVKPDHPVTKGDKVAVIESRQPGDPPPTVVLTAPQDGMVSKISVVPGQPVGPEDSLMSIVDVHEVYAQAEVPEHLAGALEKGQKAYIRVAALPEEVFEATIEHIGTLAERESGTVEAAFRVSNPELHLRPGMRAEFSIVTSSREGVTAVPRSAVQSDGLQRFVFVEDFDLKNAFLKAPVEIGAQNEQFIEITSGVLPGDRVVTRGAYSLTFAGKGNVSLKVALDAAHGHPHNEDGSEMTKEEIARGGNSSSAQGAHGPQFNALTTFFAGTSTLFFVLLMLSLIARRRPTA